jgi:hypothetical protein
MRRLTLLAALLALPVVPAHAAPAPPPTTTWVAVRTSPSARTLTVSGGAGARDHEWAMAAVASASVGPDGRFSGADGALFFGATAESGITVTSPAGQTQCKDVPNAGQVCADGYAGAGIGFAVWWDEVDFNRVFVVMRGRDAGVELGPDSAGWRLSRWTGPVRVVTNDVASAAAPFGAGAAGFTSATAVGGPGGSVAIGHPPCSMMAVPGAGQGVVRLLGGVQDKVATCADLTPPASYKPGSTEWSFSGAVAGYSDVPARLVVIERPLP